MIIFSPRSSLDEAFLYEFMFPSPISQPSPASATWQRVGVPPVSTHPAEEVVLRHHPLGRSDLRSRILPVPHRAVAQSELAEPHAQIIRLTRGLK